MFWVSTLRVGYYTRYSRRVRLYIIFNLVTPKWLLISRRSPSTAICFTELIGGAWPCPPFTKIIFFFLKKSRARTLFFVSIAKINCFRKSRNLFSFREVRTFLNPSPINLSYYYAHCTHSVRTKRVWCYIHAHILVLTPRIYF